RINQAFVRRRLLLAALVGLVGLGFLAAALGWAIADLSRILTERDAWARGATASETSVRGRERTIRLILREYEFDVEFLDASGVRHVAQVGFDTLLGRVDPRRKPSVRYLASDPRSFALSWG